MLEEQSCNPRRRERPGITKRNDILSRTGRKNVEKTVKESETLEVRFFYYYFQFFPHFGAAWILERGAFSRFPDIRLSIKAHPRFMRRAFSGTRGSFNELPLQRP